MKETEHYGVFYHGPGKDLNSHNMVLDAKDWRPRSLRPGFLISIIVISGILIGVLQYLLFRSQRDSGILFAKDLTKLPLSKTFHYLYLPTIIAVFYGFAWTWIDLDVRRIEPFYQLARYEGAPAEESMLLSYPVDFIASVPLKALRYKHWSPFVASFATVFVFWGLTPSQAGIFASSNVIRTTTLPMAYSTSHLSLEEQAGSLSAKSANSVSSILWLNETLQPYMTKDAMLAPFGPIDGAETTQEAQWTGDTWQYFANVSCEQATVWVKNDDYWLNSTWGCATTAPSLRSRAVTNISDDTKVFDTLYVGYYNIDGNADYYLSNGRCPKNESHTFMVQWSKALVPPSVFYNMSPTEQRNNAEVTSLYCRSSYFSQRVRATIQLPGRRVVDIQPKAPVETLPPDLFNSSTFEADMSEGRDRLRTSFPSLEWPDQTVYLLDSELFLGFLSRMAPFALGSTKLQMTEYLDALNLERSYQGAYRLLFARQMADVLQSSLDAATIGNGTITSQSQAITVVPAFAYVVEGLLGASCLFAACILYLSSRRPTHLLSDPASISALMSLAADNPALLDLLADMDTATTNELDATLKKYSFRLSRLHENGHTFRLAFEASNDISPTQEDMSTSSPVILGTKYRSSEDSLPGVQPLELSLKIGAAFFSFLLAVFLILVYLFVQARKQNGLALPSQNQFVRQLVENYIPTAIATMIEPFWLLLNRNLCYLEPFEVLRRRAQAARKSIGLDYLSLPPQLVFIKALLARHALLATVCLMTLLANVLSVSLSGLFFEAQIERSLATQFLQQISAQMAALDENSTELATSFGDMSGPFYIATSNETANTLLPPWSDAGFWYQPFQTGDKITPTGAARKATTKRLGATLTCEDLSSNSVFNVTGTTFDENGIAIRPRSNLIVGLRREDTLVQCVPKPQIAKGFSIDPQLLYSRPTGNCSFEFSYALQGIAGSSNADSQFCQEHLAAGWVRGQLMDGSKPPGSTSDDAVPTVVLSYTPAIMVCRSSLISGVADVTVSAGGHVLRVENAIDENASPSMFGSAVSSVIGQAHASILRTGREWHNDTNPSDFTNYLIALATNSNALLDPNATIPPFETVSTSFANTYSKLFAIWLQQNQAQLFDSSGEATTTQGFVLEQETRVFMSTTMFVLSEVILLLYMAVTACLYIQRPWKVLCRLPTSLASIICYFAASRAVHDLKGTQTFSANGRAKHLQELDHAYGFGSFIGSDRVAHVGIEKQPFVVALTRSGASSSSVDPSTDKHDNGGVRGLTTRLRHWKSGKAKEGGWL